MRIFVYWNIYDKVFTVQNRLTGRVRRHAESLTLRDADFEIDQAERDRMIRDARKTLHAGVRGEIVPDVPESLEGWTQVIYVPELHEGFVSADEGRPVARAEFVRLETRAGKPHVFAKGVTYSDG